MRRQRRNRLKWGWVVLYVAVGATAMASVAPPIGAATIRVPSEQPTIQAGVDAASESDTVLVAPGTYTGPGNYDVLIDGKGLVVRSEDGSAVGQINQVIDDFSLSVFGSPYTQWRPFLGRFEFERLPVPMEPVTVNFTLEAVLENQYLEGDWGIQVNFDRNHMRLIGDTLFTWPEPHPKGSTFSGSFQVVPLTAGLRGFSVLLKRRGYGHVALIVEWCFDLDGNLEFLGKHIEGGAQPRTYQPWYFFNEDSIQMRQHTGSKSRKLTRSELVDWKATIMPPFRIGDTSTVRYEFVARQDLVRRLLLELYLDGVELVSVPEKISPPLMAGDRVSWEIKVVPLAVSDVHSINLGLQMRDTDGPDRPDREGHMDLRGYYGVMMPCSFIFNNDGTLRLVGATLAANYEFREYLPTAFPVKGEGGREKLHIFSDREEIMRKKY